MVNKTSEKAKQAAIEEALYGNVSKNVIGACQQLVDGNHTFANLHNNYEVDNGNERGLKSSCCGYDTTLKFCCRERLYYCNITKHLQCEVIPRLRHLEYGQFSDGVGEESTFSGATTLSKNSYDQHNVQSGWVCEQKI
jgi:hypothetical protein